MKRQTSGPLRWLLPLAVGTGSALFVVAITVPSARAQQTDDNPLAPFAQFVGGEWWLGEDSYQVFEWGVGEQLVKTKSFFVTDGQPMLVSEGVWFWHPGEEAIRGYHVATEMPVYFFDYRTWFEDDKLVSDLVSFGEMGATYRETFELTGLDTFVWSLYRDGERVMGGTYSRRGR